MARRSLLPRPQFGDRVRRQSINGADLENATLQQGEEITIWSDQVPADKAYVWGVGPRDRNASNATFVDATFKASGAGTGTDGDVIENADVVLAIVDSVQEDTLAKTTFSTAKDLNDATSESRSDKPVLAEHRPAASEDRHLELRLRATGSTPDGKVVANDSVVDLYYGEIDTR